MLSRYNHLPSHKYADIEGTNLILEKNAGKPIRDYKIYGNSVIGEKGIESVGNKTKNLFDADKFVELVKKHGGTASYETIVEGRRCLNFPNYLFYHKDFSEVVNFEEGKQYTWSMDVKHAQGLATDNPDGVNTFYIGWVYDDEDYKSINIANSATNRGTTRKVREDALEFVNIKATSVAGRNVSQIGFSYGLSARWLIDLDSIQIEEGTSSTDYEPYGKYKIPIAVTSDNLSDITNIFLDEPLRKVGECADYIDYKNQQLVQNVEVVNSSETTSIEKSFASLANPIVTPMELPLITTNKFTNSLEVCTTTKPSNIKIQYYKKG